MKVIDLKNEVSMCAFLLVIRELVFPYADFHIEHIMNSKRVVLIQKMVFCRLYYIKLLKFRCLLQHFLPLICISFHLFFWVLRIFVVLIYDIFIRKVILVYSIVIFIRKLIIFAISASRCALFILWTRLRCGLTIYFPEI